MRSNIEAKQTREELVQHVAKKLLEQNKTVGFVESCTGGALANACARMAGSSTWFLGGVVSYSNSVKQKIGVTPQALEGFGVVSEEVAAEMSEAGRQWLGVDVCAAITGVAGPSGGAPNKPVGTVCFAFSFSGQVFSQTVLFSGDRHAVQSQAVDYALTQLTDLLKS